MSVRTPTDYGPFQVTRVDPWDKRDIHKRIPVTSRLLVAYWALINSFDVEEALFLQSNRGVHRLWLVTAVDKARIRAFVDDPRGRPILRQETMGISAVLEARGMAPSDQQLDELLMSLIDTRGSHVVSGEGFLAGRLSIGHWAALCGRVKRKRQEAIETAHQREREQPSELVAVARELNLMPRPVGGNAISWVSNCPGANHTLRIQSASNSWGCGYCRQNGGPDELRQFVYKRRKTQQPRRVRS